MANWTVLSDAIRQVIYSNGTRDITGQILQTALLNIVSNVGSLPAFGGTAIPSTNPGVHDGPVFYIATAEGTYANFSNIAIAKSEVPSVLICTDNTWSKQVIGTSVSADISALESALASEVSRAQAKEAELQEAVDDLVAEVEGTGLKEYIDINHSADWESGGFNATTGEPIPHATRIRTDFIEVTAGTMSASGVTVNTYCYFYDSAKAFLGGASSTDGLVIATGTKSLSWNTVLSTYPTAKYVRFMVNTTDGNIENYLSSINYSTDTLYYQADGTGFNARIAANEAAIEANSASIADAEGRLSEIEDFKESTEDFINEARGGTVVRHWNFNDASVWSPGGFNAITGEPIAHATRIRTDFFLVDGGTLAISSSENVGAVYAYIYDSSKQFLPSGDSSRYAHKNGRTIDWSEIKSAYPSAAYVRLMTDIGTSTIQYWLSVATFSNGLYSTEEAVGYEERISDNEQAIALLESKVSELPNVDKVSLLVSGDSLTFTFPNGDFMSAVKKRPKAYNLVNPCFNFESGKVGAISYDFKDDITPGHYMGATLGANHAQPCWSLTINSHGLTNSSVGTKWRHSNGVDYYIVWITDANTVSVISENSGTEGSPSYTNASTGTLTKDGTTLTITAAVSTQMWPSVTNVVQRIVDANGSIISGDGTYESSRFDFIEEYDVMTAASIVSNLVASAGSSSTPVYTGNVGMHMNNTYRFMSNGTIIASVSHTNKIQMAFQDYMFGQSMIFAAGEGIKTYVPNSMPNSGHDLRKPTYVAWGTGVDSFNAVNASMAEPNNPVNRVLKYKGTTGFAAGFLIDYGVGSKLKDLTNRTFEIRGNTGKIYPHGVEGVAVGTTLQANTTYSAVMYRILFPCDTTAPRMSMYHFDYNGAEYVFVDYSSSVFDKVEISDALSGKRITVLESKNTEVQNDVYNGGFYVKAEYVEGETCYAVVKIH